MRAQLEKERGHQDQQSHTLPVHFIVHNGDFLSVEPVLRGRAISLLDLLLRPETSVTAWQVGGCNDVIQHNITYNLTFILFFSACACLSIT